MQNKISKKELKYLIFKLGISAEELIRKNEKIFKQIKLNDKNLSEEKLINYMLEEPCLIQRPIVEIKDKVIIDDNSIIDEAMDKIINNRTSKTSHKLTKMKKLK